MPHAGYANRVARVDLNDRAVTYPTPPAEWLQKYIGARGLGVRYLLANGPRVDPLSPENLLCFMTGPLSGSSTDPQGRLAIVTKSPLTGTVTDSHQSGWAAVRLRSAGFDGLLVTGRSEQPVYVLIRAGRVEVRDASHLWGHGVHETVATLQREHGTSDVTVIAIGQASENLARFGCWMNEASHASGRGGTGAVGGSKLLKAVVIKAASGPTFEIGRDQPEPAWSIGASCALSDLGVITELVERCNDYGLDAIELGHCLAVLMEATDKGYVAADKGLRSGDGGAMLAIVDLIATRQGIGDALAEGPARFAHAVGHPELALEVKGQAVPAYDPRELQGMGIAYATSNRGADHLRGYTPAMELGLAPPSARPIAWQGKGALTKLLQDLSAFADSLDLGHRGALGEGLAAECAARFSAATGVPYTAEDALRTGERIYNLERLYNNLAGFREGSDYLPARFLVEPSGAVGAHGGVCELEPMLDEYYRLRGWNNGVIPESKLVELDIEYREPDPTRP